MAMDKSASDSYVYAKASGMLASSFVGKRASSLFSVHSLRELWSLVFPEKDLPVLPESLLAKKIENEVQERFISQYTHLLENYEKPSPLLTAFLHYFDYDNLKEAAAALCGGEKEKPDFFDIGNYTILNLEAWPDLEKIVLPCPGLSFFGTVPERKELHEYESHIDARYIREVWKALDSLDGECRKEMKKFLQEKISMDNLLWSLRLRFYYKMPEDLVVNELTYVTTEGNKDDPVAKDALQSLKWDLDERETWFKSKFSKFLNPYDGGNIWTIDPCWVDSSFKKYFVEKALRLFHLYPFTQAPMICWFILKRHEADMIRTAAEGIRLNVDSSFVMQMEA